MMIYCCLFDPEYSFSVEPSLWSSIPVYFLTDKRTGKIVTSIHFQLINKSQDLNKNSTFHLKYLYLCYHYNYTDDYSFTIKMKLCSSFLPLTVSSEDLHTFNKMPSTAFSHNRRESTLKEETPTTTRLSLVARKQRVYWLSYCFFELFFAELVLRASTFHCDLEYNYTIRNFLVWILLIINIMSLYLMRFEKK